MDQRGGKSDGRERETEREAERRRGRWKESIKQQGVGEEEDKMRR